MDSGFNVKPSRPVHCDTPSSSRKISLRFKRLTTGNSQTETLLFGISRISCWGLNHALPSSKLTHYLLILMKFVHLCSDRRRTVVEEKLPVRLIGFSLLSLSSLLTLRVRLASVVHKAYSATQFKVNSKS